MRIWPLLLLFICTVLAEETKVIRILQTSDIHGWIYGHRHDEHKPPRHAGAGELLSFKQHLEAEAAESGHGFLMFDSGDQVQGTGLSDASPVPGAPIWHFLSQLGYTGLTAGNHDLDDAGLDWFQANKSSLFPTNYVTSNLNWLGSDAAPADHTYGTSQYMAFVEPATGLRILVLGFIYNYDMRPASTDITDAATWVASAEGQDVIAKGVAQLGEVDMVVALCHISTKDAAVGQLATAIRGAEGLHTDTPLLMLTGHSHMWQKAYCPALADGSHDQQCIAIEPSCYLYMVGAYNVSFVRHATEDRWVWASLPVPNVSSSQGVQMARSTLSSFLGLPSEDELDTPEGVHLTGDISLARDHFELTHVIGCSPRTYKKNGWYRYPDSFSRLWLDAVMATVVDPDLSQNTVVTVANSGSMRDSIYAGRVTIDDKFSIFPFKEPFAILRGLTGDQLYAMVYGIPEASGRYVIPSPPSNPHYMYSIPLEQVVPSAKYDVVLPNYDAGRFQKALTDLYPSQSFAVEHYRRADGSLIDAGTMFERFFEVYMRCQPQSYLLDSGAGRGGPEVVARAHNPEGFFFCQRWWQIAAAVLATGIIMTTAMAGCMQRETVKPRHRRRRVNSELMYQGGI